MRFDQIRPEKQTGYIFGVRDFDCVLSCFDFRDFVHQHFDGAVFRAVRDDQQTVQFAPPHAALRLLAGLGHLELLGAADGAPALRLGRVFHRGCEH